jgi:apolipoprotein N-acyltransferase
VGAAAFIVSRTSLPVMLLAVLLSHIPVMPLTILRWFALFFGLPALAAAGVARALTARVRLAADEVTISRAGLRVDIALAAIARVAPWRLPLPCPGFGIVLASGRRLGQVIGASDPTPLLRALAEHGVGGAAAATEHPTIVYARVRADHGRWRWTHLLARFPLFALGPTALLFNVHQHIAYGGLLGQYYMLGLGPYLQTFAVYWATVTIYLVLYASLWRGLAEPICLLAAAVAPSRGAWVRRGAEIIIRAVYYAGVPALLALRFAPW